MTRLAGSAPQSPCDIPIENDERYKQKFAEQLLCGRDFVGVYLERRWVEPLKEYRDIVVVNSLGNEKLIEDLCIVKKRMREFYGDNTWIGITDPNCIGAPSGYCLWLKKWNEPFGEHNFCIKKVRFGDEEICLAVKSKRFIGTSHNAQFREAQTPINDHQDVDRESMSGSIPNTTSQPINLEEIVNDLKSSLRNAYSLLTIENVSSAAKFLFLLLSVLFSFSTATIKWLGEFTLRFMHEFSNLIRVCMPFLLACVELVQKTVGGFYLLLAMMWRSWMGGDNPQLPPQQLMVGTGQPRNGRGYSAPRQNYYPPRQAPRFRHQAW